MSLETLYRNCKFCFQPKGRKIKINIEIKEGKLFVNKKPLLHELFTFRNTRNIFILDEDGTEALHRQSTISSFLDNLIEDGTILIKNSRLILSM